MPAVKSYQSANTPGPSILALLVDNISRMSVSEQKILWMQLNQNKLAILAREIDANVPPHNPSSNDIDALISEAKKNGRKKKKG
ncbi:MAG TPA: hypothetical protein VL727_16055 [Puia sp.]|jgi:hypothetical protein|nr:hypothetical protein [Puia sp.]